MPDLRSQLESLAASFADQVMTAIRGASLSELVGPGSAPPRPRRGGVPAARPPKTTKGGRLARRSAEDIAAAVGDVVALLRKNKDGLRAEGIRSALKMQSKELPRILTEGLSTKMLSKKGQKRATVYSAK